MSIEAAIAEIESQIEKLDALSEVYTHGSLREAVEATEEEVDELSGRLMGHYLSGVRGKDATRVMSFRSALAMMTESEAVLVEEMVRDPAQIVWAKLTGPKKAAEYLWEHFDQIWEAVKEAFSAADSIIEFIVRFYLQVLIVTALEKLIERSAQARKVIETKARARAFPQSSGKRVWRKRTAR